MDDNVKLFDFGLQLKNFLLQVIGNGCCFNLIAICSTLHHKTIQVPYKLSKSKWASEILGILILSWPIMTDKQTTTPQK